MDLKKKELMIEGAKYLAEILNKLVEFSKSGVTLIEIDKLAEKLLNQHGEPAFKKVPGYRWSTCINVNEGVVHGIPTDRILQDRDLVKIDVGLFYKGFYTDTSTSVIVGDNQDLVEFLNVGKFALDSAIQQAKIGNRIGHISKSIQDILTKHGYSAIPELTGHGIGTQLHEKPYVPGVLVGKIENTPLLYEGQTLAIEVIYTSGSPNIILAKDGWTINTKDAKIAGLFEDTVAVTQEGPLVLTSRSNLV